MQPFFPPLCHHPPGILCLQHQQLLWKSVSLPDKMTRYVKAIFETRSDVSDSFYSKWWESFQVFIHQLHKFYKLQQKSSVACTIMTAVPH